MHNLRPLPLQRILVFLIFVWSGGEVNPLVEKYGQVIVDECHHIGAFSFDAILKQVKAKFFQ